MKSTADTLSAYAEYAFFIEALRVMDEANARANPKNMSPEEAEQYGEWIAEIGMERHIGGSQSPDNDAERIYRSTMKTRALQSFAYSAPLHAKACDCLIKSMYV